MKKVTRSSVFETNSSSTHSISITSKGNLNVPGFLELECGEFGWDEDSFTDPQTKFSYVLTAIQYHVEMPEYVCKPDFMSWEDFENWEVSKKYEEECVNRIVTSKHLSWLLEMLAELGVEYSPKKLVPSKSKWSKFGYIDHQSTDTLDELWSDDENEFKENMRNFIFNRNCILRTGNDNN